jgi:hypothetical protein
LQQHSVGIARHWRLAVFAVVCGELSAMDTSLAAEILVIDGSAKKKTAGPLAVPSLFSAFLRKD